MATKSSAKPKAAKIITDAEVNEIVSEEEMSEEEMEQEKKEETKEETSEEEEIEEKKKTPKGLKKVQNDLLIHRRKVLNELKLIQSLVLGHNQPNRIDRLLATKIEV